MYIFLHVPKSAGQTLIEIIKRQHTARWSVFKEDEWRPREAAQVLNNRPENIQKYLEICYGHLSHGIDKYVEFPVTYYTLLREPIERAISHYYHIVNTYILANHPDNAINPHPDRQRLLEGKLTLEEYISSGYCPEMDNGQTRILAGENGLFDRTPFGQCTDVLLDEAKKNLRDHIEVVGLTEQFDASLLLIQKLCGWSTPYYVRRNVTHQRPRRSEIPLEAIEAIRAHNILDLQLYAYGVQLFEERVAQQGPNFAQDVRQFQELNRRYGRINTQWNSILRTARRGKRYLLDLLQHRAAAHFLLLMLAVTTNLQADSLFCAS